MKKKEDKLIQISQIWSALYLHIFHWNFTTVNICWEKKTYFISTVIIVIIMLGFKSKYGHKRAFTCHLKLDKDPASCTKYVESTCKATSNSLTFVTFCCVEWWCDCAVVMVRISWSKWGSGPILTVLQCQANPWRGRSKLLNLIPLQKSV